MVSAVLIAVYWLMGSVERGDPKDRQGLVDQCLTTDRGLSSL